MHQNINISIYKHMNMSIYQNINAIFVPRGGIQAGKQATKQGSVCIYWKFPLSAQALAQAGFEAAMGALFGPVWQLALLLMVHVAAPDMKSRCLGNGTMSVQTQRARRITGYYLLIVVYISVAIVAQVQRSIFDKSHLLAPC